MPKIKFKTEKAGKGGWSDWIHPINSKKHNYLLKCCDCGLVHEMDFALSGGAGKKSNIFVFRARRWPKSAR